MVERVARDAGDVKGRCRPKRSGVAAASAREPDGAAPGTHGPGGAVLLVAPAPGRERTVATYVQVGDGLRDVLDPQSHV